jgi:hypothetical protein
MNNTLTLAINASHWQQRMVPHHGRTHLDLFSGIGGFALAAASAGYQTIGFSEIEPYACKILKRHWPDVPNHGDIRNIRGIRFLQDRTQVVKWWMGLSWKSQTGFMQIPLAPWSLIVVDNVWHLWFAWRFL